MRYTIYSYPKALSELRTERRNEKARCKQLRIPRRALSKAQRDLVLRKTNSRCHICGGPINGAWHADHVLSHSTGGEHAIDNYLPAHAICNNYRWDYSAAEFQEILKLGVWARTQVERSTSIGRDIAASFLRHEERRRSRRRTQGD